MKNDCARECVKELIRELCRLVDGGASISRDEFHDLCEKERFVDFLVVNHKDKVKLSYLDKNLPLFEPEIAEFVNNALGRHANVAVMEDFGLQDNAFLLGVNLCLAVLSELEDAA